MNSTITNLQYPVIRSTKPDGTVEYKPLATTDAPDDLTMNIFLPREDSIYNIFESVPPQGFATGTFRA